jgi:hypothetical protein
MRDLNRELQPLTDQFRRDSNAVRILLLTSPT